MSATRSPTTGQRYGVQRVCQAWDVPRSSFYAWRTAQEAPPTPGGKRGPKTAQTDDALLTEIQGVLAASPFAGEGYRKVWARLRVQHGVRVGAKRVLRLMRGAHLLSPHRRPKGEAKTHEGTITTAAPGVMWGTDGTKVLTVDDGYVWIFAAVEHWNAECVGAYVCKKGDRFNALQPIAQGLVAHYGGVTAGVARGLAVRMDHGSQYLADHFLNQLRHWGIAPSFAFVAEPETNGVAERFFRTLKEQTIYGRIFRNLEEVRHAVAAFVRRYNEEWLVQKLGFLSPSQARRRWHTAQAA